MSKRSLAIAAAGVGGGTDPNFKNVSLLLQGDVSNPDLTYNAFSDASSNNFAITPNGDVYGSSFSPYNTSWSNYFDGTGDYLSIAANSAFDFGSGNFTIETWINKTSSTYDILFDFQYWYSYSLRIDSNGAVTSASYNSGGGAANWNIASANGTVTSNSWNHIALVRNGSDIRLYVNGTSVANSTFAGTISNTVSSLRITHNDSGVQGTGHLSNFRIVKGTAVYTSNFTPSTTPLTAISGTSLLTCQSNRFIDNSSNNFALTRNGDVAVRAFSPFTDTDTTTGSGYFDGSGDYLTAPNNTAFNITQGDFTVEAWVYRSVSGVAHNIFSQRLDPAQTGWEFRVNSNNTLQVFYTGGSSVTSTGTVPAGVWTHVAACRSGSTCRLFINGTQDGSATFSNGTTPSELLRIGIDSAGTGFFNGYISNARIVKGTAVYTSNFTPPTSPLTAVSGTSLLTLQTRGATQNIGFVDSSPNKFPITKYGNTTQGTFSPYGTLWSNYFDGTGDWLSVSDNTALDLDRTTNWTVEAWICKTTSGWQVVVGSATSGGESNWAIDIDSSNFIRGYWVNTSPSIYSVTNTTVVSLGVWYHVALVNNNSVMSLYVNGVSVGTPQTLVGTYRNAASTTSIGRPGDYAATYFNGYISNLRIVKGTALYTSNFTPSTTPLTAVSGTSLLTCQSNRFKDNSSNNFAITVNGNPSVQRFSPFNPTAPYDAATIGGSGYFDGTGDYLALSNVTALQPGSSTTPFTIECWIYATSAPSGDNTIWGNYKVISYPTNTDGCDLLINTSKQLLFRWGYPNYADSGPSSAVALNAWNHVVICRNVSGSMSCYLNGVRWFNTSSNTTITAATASSFWIGWSGNLSGATINPFIGNIAGFSFVKGATTYNPTQTTCTVPTAPPTTNGNTSLLCNFTNAGISDAAMMNDLETVGNAQVSTSVKKYGTGSLKFDGSGDYLALQSNPNFAFGTGDFTIECWLNQAINSNAGLLQISTTSGGFYNGQTNTTAIATLDNQITIYANNGYYSTSNAPISLNTWSHIALVRLSGVIKLYVNGTLNTTIGTSGSITDTTNYTGTNLVVGGYVSTSYLLNGYIDDLRITKGYARYTANFTPPSQSLPKQ